ncbi:hypothetical protein FACS1894211_14310 [Clostridia bacterium]|nr:hypothetical protein FACS1894211_14310 [Clostridia bacterium]
MNNNMLKAALRYAENGLPVVPFWWLKSDGTCACGKEKCKRGKHPIIREWQKNASADTAQVTEWWTKYPYANIGVLCGERSGWLVLDVDAGHGGYETLSSSFKIACQRLFTSISTVSGIYALLFPL